MTVTIQFRRDTTANWTNANPTLLEGELGLEIDSFAYKIGDGVTPWNSLGYKGLSPEFQTALFDTIDDPSPPAAEKMLLYAKDIGGRMMPKFIGPSGLDSPLQPAIFSNGIRVASPGVTTSLSYFGMGALTVVGTLSHPALSANSLREQTTRGIVTSAATADSASELRHAVTSCWRGNTPGQGGFFMATRFAVSSTTANQRVAVGLFNTTSALAVTQVPSALTSCVFMGWDSADTNAQIMVNDASGTCTKIDLGAGFPANNPAHFYEFILFAKPNGSVISYRVKNLTTSAVASGDLTTDLPPSTTFLAYHAYANNGGTAAAVVLEFMRFYLETDY